jgi:hypothetical protein
MTRLLIPVGQFIRSVSLTCRPVCRRSKHNAPILPYLLEYNIFNSSQCHRTFSFDMAVWGKHSSLFSHTISDEEKFYLREGSWPCVQILVKACLRWKLNQPHHQYLSMASLPSRVQWLWVRPEPTWVEHLSGAPIHVRLLDLHKNIGLGLKGLAETNTLAYYEN